MFRNRRYSRFSRRVRRKTSAVSKIASGRVKKPSQVQALAKAVKRLQLVNKHTHEPQFLAYKGQISCVAPYESFRITPSTAWSAIFGSAFSYDINQANKVTWKSTGLDFYFTQQSAINNEEEMTSYTVFLVSLTKEGRTLCPSSSTSTTIPSLSEGEHYHGQSTTIGNIGTGLVMLNKKYFRIHRVKRFVLGNFGSPLDQSGAQSQFGNDMRFYWKVAPRKMISPPNGNAIDNTHLDPVDQYYVLIFSSNSNADLENPQCYINAINTIVPHN